MSELARLDDDLSPLSLVPARADTDSWTTVVAQVSRLAQEVAGTSFVPKGLRNDVPATTAAILYGREVGFPPMTALTQIHVIEGRPGMAAEGMRALVLAAGHDLVFEESTGAVCRGRARRRGSQSWTSLTWTLDMARAAGLLHKDNWKSYPRAMLVARCTTDLCRMIFPDVIHGFRSVEEIDDMTEGPASQVEPPSTSTVQRRSRKRAAAAQPVPRPAAASESSSPPGPPLPGEEGVPEDPSAAGRESRPPAADAPPTPPPGPDYVPGPVPEPDDGEPGERMVNRPTLRLLFREFNRLGIGDAEREHRLSLLAEITGRDLASSNDLTQDEATRAVAMLSASQSLAALRVLITTTDVEDVPEGVDEPLPAPEEEEGS